jgi:AcrR family transcriptional regulator
MKGEILEKATELFLNLGFKSVTMDDIANAMGISKKTIYAHFKNKTELVKASTFFLFDIICEGIDIICGEEKNPIEELYEIKAFAMKHLKDEKSSPQYQLQKYYPKIYETLQFKQFEIMKDCVAKNLERGVVLALYRANLNIDFITRIYFNGMIGIKNKELFPEEKFTTKSLMEDYLEYHLRGITTSNGLKFLTSFLKNNEN